MKIIPAQEHQSVDSPAVLALANDVDPRSLDLSGVSRIDLVFPKFTDGRAYSQAFLLRRRLGFTGAVFSDDLSMKGARQLGGRELSYTEAAITALEAGCDLVLLCNQSLLEDGAPIDEFLAGMSEALLKGRWTAREASELRRRDLLPRARALKWDPLMVEPRYRHALSLLP